ncbi:hypothetical protein FACS18948_5560 [Clostridia bacterium]|nr:hypothetical protein FACS18948_5560 [Clostridia bacterium]
MFRRGLALLLGIALLITSTAAFAETVAIESVEPLTLEESVAAIFDGETPEAIVGNLFDYVSGISQSNGDSMEALITVDVDSTGLSAEDQEQFALLAGIFATVVSQTSADAELARISYNFLGEQIDMEVLTTETDIYLKTNLISDETYSLNYQEALALIIEQVSSQLPEIGGEFDMTALMALADPTVYTPYLEIITTWIEQNVQLIESADAATEGHPEAVSKVSLTLTSEQMQSLVSALYAQFAGDTVVHDAIAKVLTANGSPMEAEEFTAVVAGLGETANVLLLAFVKPISFEALYDANGDKVSASFTCGLNNPTEQSSVDISFQYDKTLDEDGDTTESVVFMAVDSSGNGMGLGAATTVEPIGFEDGKYSYNQGFAFELQVVDGEDVMNMSAEASISSVTGRTEEETYITVTVSMNGDPEATEQTSITYDISQYTTVSGDTYDSTMDITIGYAIPGEEVPAITERISFKPGAPITIEIPAVTTNLLTLSEEELTALVEQINANLEQLSERLSVTLGIEPVSIVIGESDAEVEVLLIEEPAPKS